MMRSDSPSFDAPTAAWPPFPNGSKPFSATSTRPLGAISIARSSRGSPTTSRGSSTSSTSSRPTLPGPTARVSTRSGPRRKKFGPSSTAVLLKNSPQLKADLLGDQAREAENLTKRARELAEHQRQEARQATDMSRAEKVAALKRLAEEQRALETDARRLALEVDQPLTETGRARLNAEAIRRPAEAIERGEIGEGRNQLREAENDLRRFARDLEDAPTDAKALARRLAQRQDEISSAIGQALGELRGKPNVPPDERAQLAEQLQPLLRREEAVSKLAAGIEPIAESAATKDLASRASKALGQLDQALRDGKDPKALEARSNEARDALNRLANELPDPWKRTEPIRKALDTARPATSDLVRIVEKHLRESGNAKDVTRGSRRPGRNDWTLSPTAPKMRPRSWKP